MVYLFLADGFEEIEALCPVDVMRRAGIEVTTVGIGKKEITGAHGIVVTADKCDCEVLPDADSIEAVILPGGMPGADNLDKSPTVDAFLKAAKEKDAYIAAICAAPFVLGKRGYLSGKKAVCYPGFEEFLEGAEVLTDGVLSDGKIITSRGMGMALPFALELVSALRSADVSEKIRKGIIA